MSARRIRVWDLPTRLFHWLLAIVVAAASVTGLQGGNLTVWHGRLGVLLGGLLAFRLAWGVFGSTYARFAQFVRGPGAIRAYLRGEWRGPGHNPLGALSVVALLAILLFQVASGLVANDDIAFTGPLYAAVARETSDWLTRLHRLNMWVVGGLVALHLAAVLYYARVRRENLVKPMLTGYKVATDPGQESARGGGALALVAALAVAAFTVWVAAGNLLPPPPPPAPETLPGW